MLRKWQVQRDRFPPGRIQEFHSQLVKNPAPTRTSGGEAGRIFFSQPAKIKSRPDPEARRGARADFFSRPGSAGSGLDFLFRGPGRGWIFFFAGRENSSPDVTLFRREIKNPVSTTSKIQSRPEPWLEDMSRSAGLHHQPNHPGISNASPCGSSERAIAEQIHPTHSQCDAPRAEKSCNRPPRQRSGAWEHTSGICWEKINYMLR